METVRAKSLVSALQQIISTVNTTSHNITNMDAHLLELELL